MHEGSAPGKCSREVLQGPGIKGCSSPLPRAMLPVWCQAGCLIAYEDWDMSCKHRNLVPLLPSEAKNRRDSERGK